jgi:hypothetical protein
LTATTAAPGGLPRAIIFLYMACSRCCAFHDRASVSGSRPACRRRSVAPIAGRYRYAARRGKPASASASAGSANSCLSTDARCASAHFAPPDPAVPQQHRVQPLLHPLTVIKQVSAGAHQIRTASSAGDGTRTAVSSPARCSRANLILVGEDDAQRLETD